MDDRLQAVDAYIESHLPGWMEELTRLCAVPSVSARHESIPECAALCAELIGRRGFDVRVHQTGGHPVVLGHAPGRSERTMLLYNHYDVQPPEPLELWESPPFEAQIRDGAIYARGSKDDKGELVARLAALDALRTVDDGYPCGLTWLVEGEEEVSSVHLPDFVERHRDQLRVQGAIWEEGGVDADGAFSLALGVRGLLYIELHVEASARDGHSGMANLIPNAAWRLVWALSTLKGPDERIRIPGFYDGVTGPTPRQRELIGGQDTSEDEEALRRAFGLTRLLGGRTGAEAVGGAAFDPTCNIAGIGSGYQGEGSKTVIPARASAKLDFRLVPGQDPRDITQKLRAHLDAEGFEDVRIEVLGGERAGVVDPDDPLVAATLETSKEVYGKTPRTSPLIGGTTPIFLFTEEGVPVVSPGVGYGGNQAHSPNEHMRLEDFRRAARHIARVLLRFGEL
jgi:acetylornithine deacetylase/succinyl-diaminopimelate desuccinylase-like protein